MIPETMISECNEIIDQVESLMDRMKHLINSQSRCPVCLEPSDGICPECINDPRR